MQPSSSNTSLADMEEESMRSDNEKIQKKLQLEPTDSVLYSLKCRKKQRHGILAITEQHLHFYSSLLGTTKKKKIAFDAIAKIELVEKDGGVKIIKNSGESITFHFKQNETAHLLIEGQWEASGNNPNMRLTESSMGSKQLYTTPTSSALHKHFELPETEVLKLDVPCSFKTTFKHYGKLYLTQNYICFYSHFITSHTRRVIKIRNIITISKPEKKNRHSILVETKTESFLFSSFQDREKVYDFMVNLYNDSKNDTSSLPPTPNLRSRRNSLSGSLSGVPSKSHSRSGSVDQQSPMVENTITFASVIPISDLNNSSNNNNNNNGNNGFRKVSNASSTLSPNNNNSNNNNNNNSSQPSTPKTHSRNNSVNKDKQSNIPPSPPTPLSSSVKTVSSPSTNNNVPSSTTVVVPASEKIANRIEKVDNVIPKQDTLNLKQKELIKEKDDKDKTNQKAKRRVCCFSLF
ncbi:hypothetical protein CYY_007548 [Polysphondylium violaceum]|uniref:GRAM domain-containing protein n=1 Tax=Polysphondylium violaceum TaxID=133409 RepID=A0A8J4PNJ5_9MYCE|nr:hypothetical protein CYY_007548 [Polysphondylium violaceum]